MYQCSLYIDAKQIYVFSFLDQFTAIANYAILACITYEWMLYLGAAISFLDFASTTMFRSTITKNVQIITK